MSSEALGGEDNGCNDDTGSNDDTGDPTNNAPSNQVMKSDANHAIAIALDLTVELRCGRVHSVPCRLPGYRAFTFFGPTFQKCSLGSIG